MESKLLFSGLNCLDCKGFKQLLDTQSLVDCTLACDGGKISAHKLVLSACSSYLARILLDHPVEHPIIILPELNIEDVRTLVHYMYTGELLKSDTINSISLLRTAAILSINSLNDLLLSSNSSSPNSLMSSHQFASANNNHNNNNNNMNNSNNTICQTAMHSLQQDRYSIVEQISPLLAAISQQQQQQQQQQLNQAFATRIGNDGNTGSFSMNQNENISRNLSASSHDSISSTNSSNFSSILGAAAAAAVASVSAGGSGSSAVAQLYNSLTGSRPVNSPMTNALNLNSSSSSTSPSPNNNNNNNKPTNFSVPEPFAYSSAITGIVTVANTNTSSNNHDSSNNNSTSSQASSTTNEFQFKCPVCQNHFQTICSFEYHMQRAHSVTSFGCEICHKPFASLRYVLTDHMRRCHGWNGATNTSNNGQANQSSNNNEREQKLHC